MKFPLHPRTILLLCSGTGGFEGSITLALSALIFSQDPPLPTLPMTTATSCSHVTDRPVLPVGLSPRDAEATATGDTTWVCAQADWEPNRCPKSQKNAQPSFFSSWTHRKLSMCLCRGRLCLNNKSSLPPEHRVPENYFPTVQRREKNPFRDFHIKYNTK